MQAYLQAVKGKKPYTYKAYQIAIEALDGKTLDTLPENVVIQPTYMTDKAVGADCFASKEVGIGPGEIKIVPIGFKAKFDGDKFGLFAYIRSSTPKRGLMLANGVGVIEEDYFGNPNNDGEIGFMFYNYTSEEVVVRRFDRVGQLALQPIHRFENAGRAGMARGASGSTGK